MNSGLSVFVVAGVVPGVMVVGAALSGRRLTGHRAALPWWAAAVVGLVVGVASGFAADIAAGTEAGLAGGLLWMLPALTNLGMTTVSIIIAVIIHVRAPTRELTAGPSRHAGR